MTGSNATFGVIVETRMTNVRVICWGVPHPGVVEMSLGSQTSSVGES